MHVHPVVRGRRVLVQRLDRNLSRNRDVHPGSQGSEAPPLTASLKTMSLSGLLIAAGVWAFYNQLGYWLVTSKCEQTLSLVPLIGVACLLPLAAGALLSNPAPSPTTPDYAGGKPRSFIRTISFAAAGLFALAIGLQAVGGFIIA